ncbi:MAG: hypothetical protein AB1921_12670 [Thermodesulfobacteriota bacterium]
MPKEPEFIQCSQGKSFFKIIEDLWVDIKSPSVRSIHRLCSLMRKMGATSFIKEKLLPGDDAETDQELQSLKLKFGGHASFISVYKITFFKRPTYNYQQAIELNNEDFLSYAVIINANWQEIGNNVQKTVNCSYILRSVVALPTIKCPVCEHRIAKPNAYYHVYSEYYCCVYLGRSKGFKFFTVTGTFFSQQNGSTSVCAHAALKSMVNNMNSNTFITTAYINNMIGFNLEIDKELWPEFKDIENLLRNMGFFPIVYNFFDSPNQNYADHLHHMVESSFPSLLLFTTHKVLHVVSVNGHTINPDIWRPEAEVAYGERGDDPEDNYCSATRWVDNFIIHDDNFGMYLTLPVDSLSRITIPKKDRNFRAFSIVGLAPRMVLEPGNEIEARTYNLLKSMHQLLLPISNQHYWLKELYNGTSPWVFRTALITKDRYRVHLGYRQTNRHPDSYGNIFSDSTIETLTDDFDNYLWLCEVSVPDLYATNKAKIADFIHSCADNDDEKKRNNCKLIRLPGIALFLEPYLSQKINSYQISALAGTGITGHYPLFKVSRELNSLHG